MGRLCKFYIINKIEYFVSTDVPRFPLGTGFRTLQGYQNPQMLKSLT